MELAASAIRIIDAPALLFPLWVKSGSAHRLAGGLCTSKGQPSNGNPLDLIERYLIAAAVIELGGARAFVRRH
jgi:hypothetical protein